MKSSLSSVFYNVFGVDGWLLPQNFIPTDHYRLLFPQNHSGYINQLNFLLTPCIMAYAIWDKQVPRSKTRDWFFPIWSFVILSPTIILYFLAVRLEGLSEALDSVFGEGISIWAKIFSTQVGTFTHYCGGRFFGCWL